MTTNEARLRDVAAIELAVAKLHDALVAMRAPLQDAIAAFRTAASSEWLKGDADGRITYLNMATHLDRMLKGSEPMIATCAAIAAEAVSEALLTKTTLDRAH